MILRRDHVAGGALIVAAAFVWAISGDLPFGSLASPGAGMLPMLLVGLLGAFGAILFLHAGQSPPITSIDWGDARHALAVVVVVAAATAVYTTLGFLITIPAMLFILVFVIERKPLLPAAIFSIGAVALAYGVFGLLLKAPLPRGPWGF